MDGPGREADARVRAGVRWSRAVRLASVALTTRPRSRYVDYVFSWVESQVDDPKIFPVNESDPFPPDFVNHYAKDIFKRLFRTFAVRGRGSPPRPQRLTRLAPQIIYHRHMDKITAENAAAHLNTCFKHFMFFSFQFNLIEETELKVLKTLVDRLREEYDKA